LGLPKMADQRNMIVAKVKAGAGDNVTVRFSLGHLSQAIKPEESKHDLILNAIQFYLLKEWGVINCNLFARPSMQRLHLI
jgi:hypothetical protein